MIVVPLLCDTWFYLVSVRLGQIVCCICHHSVRLTDKGISCLTDMFLRFKKIMLNLNFLKHEIYIYKNIFLFYLK